MAEIDLFHYRQGLGILHSMDTRIKLLSVLLLTIITFQSNSFSLLLISVFVVFIFLMEYVQSKILSPLRFLKGIRFFLIFLFFITLTRGLTIEGQLISFIPFFSLEGILSGLIYSWKLFIILLTSQLLTATTDPTQIHGVLYRILKPVPFIPAGQIATMVSLTIAFIPLLFDQYLEVQNASYSRLGNRTKNPLKKIRSIALPLLQTTIFRADEVAQAMESRCYNENPTLPEMKIEKRDVKSLLILTVFFAIIFLSNILI